MEIMRKDKTLGDLLNNYVFIEEGETILMIGKLAEDYSIYYSTKVFFTEDYYSQIINYRNPPKVDYFYYNTRALLTEKKYKGKNSVRVFIPGSKDFSKWLPETRKNI